jgi:diguanylate cyclase (GGDEF)-like protein
MTTRADYTELCPFPDDQAQAIQKMLAELLESGDSNREECLRKLLGVMEDTKEVSGMDKMLRDHSGLFIHKLSLLLAGGKSSHKSPLYDFLILLNHIPIRKGSHWEHLLEKEKFAKTPHPEEFGKLFDELQLIYLLCNVGDMGTATRRVEALAPKPTLATPRLYAIYAIIHAQLLFHAKDYLALCRFWLEVIVGYNQIDGAETALYFVIRWLVMISWPRDPGFKISLLLQMNTALQKQNNLNSAIVLYELFSSEDRHVGPAEKMQFVVRLIKHSAALLTPQQLQLLYFFAGNYRSGMQARFKESIQYFQYSNYFLHKHWDYYHNAADYLQEHLEAAEYKCCMNFLEQRIMDLGNHVSIQNNAYVETLQANYDKIEELLKQVEELSETDTLTGLRNRRFLESNLHHTLLLASRHRVPVCFAILDIDHFKMVNDIHGHLAGDFVLKEIATLLTANFRKSDVIVRFGGEEFLLVLFDIVLEKVMPMLEEIRTTVEAHVFSYRGTDMNITISIGVTCDTADGFQDSDISSHIAKADAALYRAKNSGRNKVVH